MPAAISACRTASAAVPFADPACRISPSAVAQARCSPKLSPRILGRRSLGSHAIATPAAIRSLKTETSAPTCVTLPICRASPSTASRSRSGGVDD